MDDDSESHENHTIRFKGKDERTFEVSAKAASIAELVQDVPKEDGDVTEIEITRVTSACLEKVVQFMEHYNEEPMTDIPTPLGASTFNEVRGGGTLLVAWEKLTARMVGADCNMFSLFLLLGHETNLVPTVCCRRQLER